MKLILPALALSALLLAACGNPVRVHDGVAVTGSAVMPAPPTPPSVAARAAEQRVVAAATNVMPGSGQTQMYRPSPMPMPIPMPAPVVAPQSTDKFPEREANKAQLVAEQPVSTFSVDVDTASYAFVRRTLSANRMPHSDAVRVEEMVNYFPYDYRRPADAARPFNIATEVMPSPWKAGNQLLHIAVRGYDIVQARRPRANIVLLVDVSGSMQHTDRLPLLKQGFSLFVEQIREDDRVAIVSYANGAKVVLESTSGRNRQLILDAIAGLTASGRTAGGEGLQRAYALAERNYDPKAVNRIILATDGDFNLGMSNMKELEKFIAGKRKTGVYLSIFGVGMGNLNDALIQRLAQSGNGNAAYIDSLLEARKALGEELGSTMFPIANDVKVQVEFNPAQVAAYRLIGYETRMLQRQDFKDDKVDAGDMGAGHTVTAIYEITPASAAATLVDPLRYGDAKAVPAPASGAQGGAKGEELCFVKLRYKLPNQETSREIAHPVLASSAHKSLDSVPSDQRFAVAVAAFGQRLRGERQVSDYSYQQIASLANAARGEDNEGYRAEFVKLVRMADSLDKVGQAGGQH